jgi:hypothetical protein
METMLRKLEWGDGRWQAEPDYANWIDPATDLDCLIVRSAMTGALCGDVGVPPEHPLHGADYDDIEVEVHGGLTFAGPCDEGAAARGEIGICHVPAPGRPADVYWLGFDCAHAFDLAPATDALYRRLGLDLPLARLAPTTYRDFDYVRAHVESLARQLAEFVA